MRGNASLEFLEAYGWAIALVVIVAAALFALDVFDFSQAMASSSAGGSGLAARGWQLDSDGTFMLRLSNQAGKPVNITSISVAMGNATVPVMGTPLALGAGKSTGTLSTANAAFGAQEAGAQYAAAVQINCLDSAGSAASTNGTLEGKVA